MGNHFHDTNGWLIAGIDGHYGIHWPFTPLWFYKLNLMHPFVLGDKQRGTVFFNGVQAVAAQHAPKYLWPHIGIIPDALDLLTPLHIFFGTHRAWLPKVSVIGEGEPLAICAIVDGVSTDLDCWDFGHLPTSLVLNDGTVETTATWDDYAAGLKTALINLAVEGAIFLLTMGAGKLLGKGLSRVFQRGAAEGAEAAARDAAESLEGAEREAAEAAAESAGREAGEASEAAGGKCTREGEPVDVATGAVVDSHVDLKLNGAIPFVWRRSYSSRRARRRTALGRGGWSHSFEQWIEEEARVLTLHAEDGREIYFAKVKPGESTFHRRERLTLTALAGGAFAVHSLDTRLTRELSPLTAGGPARLRAVRDAYGNAITLEVTGDKLSRIIDTAGREIRLKLDAGARVSRVEVWVSGALELWHDYAYTERGELASATDALGNAETYAYDDDRRLVKKTMKNGTSFYYEYDDKTGWCVRTWGDGEIHRVELRPDLEARTTITSGNAEPRIYTWNDRGVVLRAASPDGTFLRTRVYDDDLYLLAEENGAGERTSFEYDARGSRTKEIDPAGNVTEWAYEADLQVQRVEPGGLVTTYSYDARGALIAVTSPSHADRMFEYDGYGHLANVYGADGLLIGFSYDARHNVVEETSARGARTRYAYDSLGRPVARVDALGRETRIDFDRIGRPVAIRFPDGTSRSNEYDPLGKVVRATDALGQVTTMAYSGTGVLCEIELADHRRWRFSYDARERLRRIKNPADEFYEFGYNSAGRVERERTFDGRNIIYLYGRSGRLSRIEYPDRTWREFSCDPLGNVVDERSPDGGIRFERDQLGRLWRCVVEEEAGEIVNLFERDSLGRVTAETQGSRTIRYERDAHGRVTARILPSGEATRYQYDRAGALSSVEHEGHRVAIERDVLGRELCKHVGAELFNVESAYDAMDHLIDRRVSAPSPAGEQARVVLSRRRWSYDAIGRPQQIEDTRWGAARYRWDPVGRVVEASRDRFTEIFEYDAADSLRNILDNLEQVGRSPWWRTQTGNLLVQTHGARFEYDVRGRRVRKTLLDAEQRPRERPTEYRWDCRDRLREVRLPSGHRVRFAYDAFARRVRKEIVFSEGERRSIEFLWDGDVLAAELHASGTRRVFVHELRTMVPLLQQERGIVFTYVNDHLGTPQELIDRDGRVAWSAEHSTWGEVKQVWRDPAARQAVDSPFRLLGQYADEEIGLCYSRFRYFDAATARWCSPDPLGFSGGTNLFAFDGNPLTSTDPFGLIDPDKLADIPRGPGIYHVESGGNVYTGSGVNIRDRVTTSDHPARALFDAEDAAITTREVDLGTAATRRETDHILRYYEQQVMDAEGNVSLREDPASNSLNKIRAARESRMTEFGNEATEKGTSMGEPKVCGG